MSAEFRQRTPGEYLQLAWKRRWLIILPAVAIFTAVAWVVWRLPNVYESTTLLIVKPPTISPNIVPTLSDYDLGLRINNISQRVQSRSVLEPLILKYDLYQAERRNGEPMELTVERMRKEFEARRDLVHGEYGGRHAGSSPSYLRRWAWLMSWRVWLARSSSPGRAGRACSPATRCTPTSAPSRRSAAYSGGCCARSRSSTAFRPWRVARAT